MSKDAIILPTTRNWRDIPQEVKPRAMSPEGRKRLVISLMKVTISVLALGCVGWTAWKISAVFTDDTRHMPAAAKAVPITRYDVSSRGVLTTDWVKTTLALAPSTSLIQLDLQKLRETLMANPQVQDAEIIRQFPSTLEVHLSERSPVARVSVQVQDGAQAKPYVVARDGVVYEGVGYKKSELIDTLPWLDGIKLVPQGKGFTPIAGMDSAADLIAQAELHAPQIYADWQVVSLAKLASDHQIEVRTIAGTRILFSTDETPLTQLGELDYILDAAKTQGKGPIQTIDLTVGPQVQVVYGDPASLVNPTQQQASSDRKIITVNIPSSNTFLNGPSVLSNSTRH